MLFMLFMSFMSFFSLRISTYIPEKRRLKDDLSSLKNDKFLLKFGQTLDEKSTLYQKKSKNRRNSDPFQSGLKIKKSINKRYSLD